MRSFRDLPLHAIHLDRGGSLGATVAASAFEHASKMVKWRLRSCCLGFEEATSGAPEEEEDLGEEEDDDVDDGDEQDD